MKQIPMKKICKLNGARHVWSSGEPAHVQACAFCQRTLLTPGSNRPLRHCVPTVKTVTS